MPDLPAVEPRGPGVSPESGGRPRGGDGAAADGPAARGIVRSRHNGRGRS